MIAAKYLLESNYEINCVVTYCCCFDQNQNYDLNFYFFGLRDILSNYRKWNTNILEWTSSTNATVIESDVILHERDLCMQEGCHRLNCVNCIS